MLLKLKPGLLVLACDKLEVCLVLSPQVLAHWWIFPGWTAGVSCSLHYLQSCLCLGGPQADAAGSVSPVLHLALSLPAALGWSLDGPWSWFTTLPPGLLLSAPWPHSGIVGLCPVSGAILSSWLILLMEQPCSCSSLTYKCLPCRRKKAAFSKLSPAWFLVAKSDVPPSPGCIGRCNELSISCWVCDVPLFPGWSWTSCGRMRQFPWTLLWVLVWGLMPAPQPSLSISNENSHLLATLQSTVEPPLEQ